LHPHADQPLDEATRRKIIASVMAVMVLGALDTVFGSVMCALAPTMLALIVGRAVQGLGGGATLSIS
jgi:MFS family permease